MLDQIFLTVSDLRRSIAFYQAVLPALGIAVAMTAMARTALPATPT